MNKIQSRLKATRIKRGFTQAQLAKRAYMSKNTISNIERGLTKRLKEEEVHLLSNALLVTEDFLLGLSDDENKTSEGLTQPLYILPEWNWETEIKQVLKKHSNHRCIEVLLRDCVYFLGQIDTTVVNYHNRDEILILEKVLRYLNTDAKKDNLSLLNGFLDLIMKKTEED